MTRWPTNHGTPMRWRLGVWPPRLTTCESQGALCAVPEPPLTRVERVGTNLAGWEGPLAACQRPLPHLASRRRMPSAGAFLSTMHVPLVLHRYLQIWTRVGFVASRRGFEAWLGRGPLSRTQFTPPPRGRELKAAGRPHVGASGSNVLSARCGRHGLYPPLFGPPPQRNHLGPPSPALSPSRCDLLLPAWARRAGEAICQGA